MVYASLGQMKCFECGDVGWTCFVCLHKKLGETVSGGGSASGAAGVSTGAEAASGATSVAGTPVFNGAGTDPVEVDNPLQTEAAHGTGSIEADGPVAACT